LGRLHRAIKNDIPPSWEDEMKSYASLHKGFGDTVSEFWNIYLAKTQDVAGYVAGVVAKSKEMEQLTEEQLGMKLEDLHILEIGAGQQLLRLRYFAAKNQVTAVDYDVIPQGLAPAAYWKVLRQNGALRLVKTVLRKIAGIDRACWRELEKRTGQNVRGELRVVQGDAHALPWADSSFDFIYSFSVFEHLENPTRCLEEAVRVLRPGGGMCIGIHLYTSDSGCHDPRIFSGHRDQIAYWAHLRPGHEQEVRPNAYLNRWTLAQWEGLFHRQCPGVSLHPHVEDESQDLEGELRRLRSQGELEKYSDQELLTADLWALWKKPATSSQLA